MEWEFDAIFRCLIWSSRKRLADVVMRLGKAEPLRADASGHSVSACSSRPRDAYFYYYKIGRMPSPLTVVRS